MLSNSPWKINRDNSPIFPCPMLNQAQPSSEGVGLRSVIVKSDPSDNFLLDFPCQRFIKEKIHNLYSSTLKK